MKKNKKQTTPYISDDFQIGPDGAYEHNEEIAQKYGYKLEKVLKEYKKDLLKKEKRERRKNGDE